MSSSINCCPICMDNIDVTINCLVTDCGHSFHTSCLMKNVSYNGFDCPYCRTKLVSKASIILEEDLEEDFGENIYNELDYPVEEHIESEHIESEHIELQNENILPSYEFITRKLINKDITIKQLVKYILSNHPSYSSNEELTNNKELILNNINSIISDFTLEDADYDYYCDCEGYCRICC